MLKFYFFLIIIIPILTSMSFSQTDTITILHVNDTHSCLAPLGPRNSNLEGTQGGISRAATVIGMNKMTEQNVLTLHGGDVFIGDFFFNKFFGVAEFQLMVSLGFDVMAVMLFLLRCQTLRCTWAFLQWGDGTSGREKIRRPL